MTPTLYYFPVSPPCRAVLLLGRLIDVQFDLRPINIYANEQLKPNFVNLNPQHCLPTLCDKGLILWESRAILTYLITSYAKDDSLYPKDVRIRAMVDQRLQFDLGTLYQRMVDYYFPTIKYKAPLEEPKRAKLEEALIWFDAILKGRTWVAAGHFTVADLALCVTISQIEAFGLELSSFGRTRQWLKRCKVFLEPFGYKEINQSGADTLMDYFLARLR